MTESKATNPRRNVLLAASFVLLPAVLFYAVLLRVAVNIPCYDDYDAILNYLNQLTQLHTLSGRLAYLLAAQHNEYKIFTTHALVWMQYAAFGDVNFQWMEALGNAFVLLLGVLLWRMFLPHGAALQNAGLARRLALFLPVSLLLFQLNFAEALDWAMPSIQCLGVVFFSLAAIYLLHRATPASFVFAVLLLALSIASLTNGFLLALVGGLMLLVGRRYAQLAIWSAATAACVAAYLYRYTVMPSPAPTHVAHFGLLLRPVYVAVFLGAALMKPLPSLVLGIAIVAYVVYMLRRGYHRRNPLVSWCVLFLLLTAIGVAGIRSDFGVAQATVPRYRIYSDLLLVFAWFSLLEEFPAEFALHHALSLRRSLAYRTALAGCVVFAVVCDGWGAHFLQKRRSTLIQGVALYEHPIAGQPPGPVIPDPNQPPRMDAWDLHARTILIQSTQLGIYAPPPLER